VWIELIEFQHSQVGVQIIGVVSRLLLDILLESLVMNWIVSVRVFIFNISRKKTKLENREKTQFFEFWNSPFYALQHLRNGHDCSIVGFDYGSHYFT
jgi:hypothetical protein